jgi:hypothetical protein
MRGSLRAASRQGKSEAPVSLECRAPPEGDRAIVHSRGLLKKKFEQKVTKETKKRKNEEEFRAV